MPPNFSQPLLMSIRISSLLGLLLLLSQVTASAGVLRISGTAPKELAGQVIYLAQPLNPLTDKLTAVAHDTLNNQGEFAFELTLDEPRRFTFICAWRMGSFIGGPGEDLSLQLLADGELLQVSRNYTASWLIEVAANGFMPLNTAANQIDDFLAQRVANAGAMPGSRNFRQAMAGISIPDSTWQNTRLPRWIQEYMAYRIATLRLQAGDALEPILGTLPAPQDSLLQHPAYLTWLDELFNRVAIQQEMGTGIPRDSLLVASLNSPSNYAQTLVFRAHPHAWVMLSRAILANPQIAQRDLKQVQPPAADRKGWFQPALDATLSGTPGNALSLPEEIRVYDKRGRFELPMPSADSLHLLFIQYPNCATCQTYREGLQQILSSNNLKIKVFILFLATANDQLANLSPIANEHSLVSTSDWPLRNAWQLATIPQVLAWNSEGRLLHVPESDVFGDAFAHWLLVWDRKREPQTKTLDSVGSPR